MNTDVLAPIVTCQEESFADVWPELEPCLDAHWREIAQDQDKMPLDVDVEAYKVLGEQGRLSVVTLRVTGELVGYFAAFIHHHLHYRQTLCAHVDVYYLKPAYRGQGYGRFLFQVAEAALQARGVQKVFAGTKVYADVSPLFAQGHWVKTETLYTKWIGA
jgi:GNAT superfamily N-acetyltransferase